MKKILLLLFLALFMSSCQKDEKHSPLRELEIDLDNEIKAVKFSDYLTEVDFVALETTPESLIGRVNKVVSTGNYIFILDTYSTESIFMFDKNGKFIQKIGKQGDGPEQYTKPMDFIVDGNMIRILDNGYFVITYDFENNFVSKEKLPDFSAFKLAQASSKTYSFISGKRMNNLILTDADFEIQNTYFPFVSTNVDKLIVNSFIKTGSGTTLYRRNLNDTLYEIGSPKIKPHTFIDYQGKNFPFNEYLGLANIDEKIKQDKMEYCTTRYYYENKNHGLLVFLYESEPWIYLFSKKNDHSKLFKYTSRVNDVTFDPGTYVVGMEGDQFIFLVSPNNLIEGLKKGENKQSPFYDRLKKISRKIQPTDNPILMYAKLNLENKNEKK